VTTFQLLMLALVGGALSVDAVSLGQSMASRPIVAATITGFLFGAPGIGLMIGAALEMLAMETMPFGASRYLEWSCGAVVGASFACLQPELTGMVLVSAILFALLAAWLAGSSMVVMRKINGRLAVKRRDQIAGGDVVSLRALQVTGLALDFVRGALLAAGTAAAALHTGSLANLHEGAPGDITSVVVSAVPASVALAAGWRLFAEGSRRKYLLLLGALIGIAAVSS
jgi:mannose/fructose/N-acetylgalactosamine-specific phosphotransferase system component IIC